MTKKQRLTALELQMAQLQERVQMLEQQVIILQAQTSTPQWWYNQYPWLTTPTYSAGRTTSG